MEFKTSGIQALVKLNNFDGTNLVSWKDKIVNVHVECLKDILHS